MTASSRRYGLPQAWSPRLATTSLLSSYEDTKREAKNALLGTFAVMYIGLEDLGRTPSGIREFSASGGVASATTCILCRSATAYGMRATSVQNYVRSEAYTHCETTSDAVGDGCTTPTRVGRCAPHVPDSDAQRKQYSTTSMRALGKMNNLTRPCHRD